MQLDGQISASISINHETDDLRNELASLIWYAERLIYDTCVSANGFDIPINRYWATQNAHDIFQSAIEDAQDVFSETDALFPGDTFTATVSMEGNTGFAGMLLRIRIPEGLELIGIIAHNQPNMEYGLELPMCINGILPSEFSPLRGDVFTGWAGRSTNFYGNGLLFTYTFRVTDERLCSI
ncbi:MAG: hypothetical protein FWF79_07380 [Defluviitaleaceae bacterium]|nr:hypothetical protein [Defluviitaleaceae bacterium]